MQKTRDKINAIAICFMLILSMAATIMSCISDVRAETRTPSAFVAVAPNPVGVGQTVTVNAWLQPSVNTYHNYTVTITRPDGTTETKFFEKTWTIGSVFFTYSPSQVGTYYFQLSYPGETILGLPGMPMLTPGDYTSAVSPKTPLVVQEEAIAQVTENPLPTDYWTRPIDAYNRQWSSISGNWLEASYNATYRRFDAATAYNPYSNAPRSAHVAWTKEIAFGGLVGGEFGNRGFYTGLSYENKFNGPVIIAGKLYYNAPLGSSAKQGLACVNLRTGEDIWFQKGITINCGQLLVFDSGNQHGIIPYLWSTSGNTYIMYDAFTGDEICRFANASSGTLVHGEKGELLVYVYQPLSGWLAMWNSTRAFERNGMFKGFGGGGDLEKFWRPRAGTFDWQKGIEWNATIPVFNAGFMSFTVPTGDVLVVAPLGIGEYRGYSLTDGHELWASTPTLPEVYEFSLYFAFGEGVFARYNNADLKWYGYDVNTGRQIWVSAAAEYPWGSYMASQGGLIANGKLYAGTYDGYVHCYDIETGKKVWSFYSGNAGYNTPYGTYPMFYGPCLADGVIFSANGEHSPDDPLYRGYKLYAIDEETGEEIWSIGGWWPLQAIVDGYLLTYSGTDNQIYCFGKGQTAVTVSAPDVATTIDTPVVIKGTITDQSPGSKDTPAVSEESMSAWMEYLHLQQPMPTNATGVEVLIDVLDANGNYRNVGTATSDLMGFFSFEWQPDIPGKYTVVATFAGSDSYYASCAETAFTVVEPTVTPPPTPTPASVADMYFLPVSIGMIVAIVIVLVLLVILLLRKR